MIDHYTYSYATSEPGNPEKRPKNRGLKFGFRGRQVGAFSDFRARHTAGPFIFWRKTLFFQKIEQFRGWCNTTPGIGSGTGLLGVGVRVRLLSHTLLVYRLNNIINYLFIYFIIIDGDLRSLIIYLFIYRLLSIVDQQHNLHSLIIHYTNIHHYHQSITTSKQIVILTFCVWM